MRGRLQSGAGASAGEIQTAALEGRTGMFGLLRTGLDGPHTDSKRRAAGGRAAVERRGLV
jgi:hypothetical protein